MPAAPISSSVLRPSLVDHAHPDHGEDQVGESDRNRLLIARQLAESGRLKDVVQVVENRVDPRQLIECSNRDRQKQRIAILPSKHRLMRRCMFLRQRLANVGQFRLRLRLAHQFQHRQRFIDAIARADQRGLRGMPNSNIRNPSAGTAATPTCQRHSAAPRCRSRIR